VVCHPLPLRGDLTSRIGEGITSATERLRHFEPMHSNILAQLADIYSETISTMKPRIIVHGEPLHLSATENVNLIRALLLSGIRAARLFHQSDGSWFQTILRRKQYLAQVEALLDDCERRCLAE
jgi:high frequency lysogenization protein